MCKVEIKKVGVIAYLEEVNSLMKYKWTKKVDDESFEEYVQVIKRRKAGKIVNRIYRNRIEIRYFDKDGRELLEETHSMD